MDPYALATELERDPFVPLRLRLSDGRQLDIFNPGLTFISKLVLYYFRPDRPHSVLAQDHMTIALRHIVSIEHIEPAKR